MDNRPQRAGLRDVELLSAHCRSLDPDAASASARLEAALGPELARKLLFALAQRVVQIRRAV